MAMLKKQLLKFHIRIKVVHQSIKYASQILFDFKNGLLSFDHNLKGRVAEW